MFSFSLPSATVINKPIPKSAFDNYTNWRQKKNFTDQVYKITWQNKLSTETTNLPSKEIAEIQLFSIELKFKTTIEPILKIIDKAIPYHILFLVFFQDEIYFSLAKKHQHPLNDDNTVIDWIFSSDWQKTTSVSLKLSLSISIDNIFLNLCNQLSHPGLRHKELDLESLIKSTSELSKLQLEISRLTTLLNNEKQFNRKVKLNTKLNALKRQLENLSSTPS